MLRNSVSRRNLILISLGLLILAAMTVVLAPKGVLATTFKGDEDDQKKDLFYTTSFSGGSAELVAIKVSGSKITTTNIGPGAAPHWRCHPQGHCSACAATFSGPSSLRPSTRKPD